MDEKGNRTNLLVPDEQIEKIKFDALPEEEKERIRKEKSEKHVAERLEKIKNDIKDQNIEQGDGVVIEFVDGGKSQQMLFA